MDVVHETGLRPGRPRDPACDEAILEATIDLFVKEGYAGLSIEGVAARAGVGKATIYRRFASKAELVVEAIRVRTCVSDHLPDTGDLRADLTSMLQRMAERLRSPEGKALTTLMAERLRNPDLADEFERSVIGAKRAHATHLVRSAMARGDLPADTDVDLTSEFGPALLWYHALNELPITEDLPERIIGLLLPSDP